MSLYRRGSVYWVSHTLPNGRRIRESTGIKERLKAQEYHAKFQSEMWRIAKLGEKPRYTWTEAVVRWCKESSHKATIENDKLHLRWLDKHLKGKRLDEISRNVIDHITDTRQKEGVKNATVNRMLEVLRAILRKAASDWEWLDKVPMIRMLSEPKRRIRWITREEAEVLLKALPKHLSDMARFSLATGLRKSNVTGLEWSQVDLVRRTAWVHPDQAKARKAITVPLNEEAVSVIRKQIGKHPTYVFSYKGRAPIKYMSTKSWKHALDKVGIKDFRWHDLRHTWASWHVQNGTPLQVLQELGAWESVEMVRRYAHLASDHLAEYADRVLPKIPSEASVTILAQQV